MVVLDGELKQELKNYMRRVYRPEAEVYYSLCETSSTEEERKNWREELENSWKQSGKVLTTAFGKKLMRRG